MKFDFKKICKWPMFILSILLFVVCLTSLIVSCTRNVSLGKYRYKDVDSGVEVQSTFSFINGKEVVLETISKQTDGAISVSEMKYQYKVVDGRLFLKEEADTLFDEFGKINSTKIILKEAGMTATFTNGGAIASIVVSAVFVVIFALCGVGTGLYTFKGDAIFNKCKQKKQKTIEQTTEE